MARISVPLEEKNALEEALINYCTMVDSLSDIDGIVDCFTEDALLDLSGLKLDVYRGADRIREFYTRVFKDMSHHMHMMTNFRVTAYDGATASVYAYVAGMGRSQAGIDVLVYVYYDLDLRKCADGIWRFSRFYEAPQLPMPSSVTEVHG
ncbi:MAG: nuclear transport factor 2 family protein [Sphingomonadaceae bacterium]